MSATEAYQASFLNRKQTSAIDFPNHIHIETQAICNAACSFCPYPDLERKGQVMPTALFEKIIDDLCAIPKLHRFQLSPFKVNEPLMETRLYQFLALIQDKLPNAVITLTTNASLLNKEHINNLSEQNLGYLWILFNDHRKVDYQETMRLPFQRTYDNLQLLHKEKGAGRFNPRVVLSRVGDGSSADTDFAQWVKYEFPHFESSIFPRGDWMGQVKSNQQDNIALACGCSRWFELSITATGKVALCCMDGQAKHIIGDIKVQSVLEVYNSPKYRVLRTKMVNRQDVDFCKSCTFL